MPAHLRQIERAVSRPTAAQGGWRHSGRAAAEVGAVLIVGGNIDGFTRTMTTAIALEASKGDVVVNAAAWGLRRARERFAG